jgi:hypothetical protein
MFLRKHLGAELKDVRPLVGNYQVRCYALPPLKECRRLFAESLGQLINWRTENWETEEWQQSADWHETLKKKGV